MNMKKTVTLTLSGMDAALNNGWSLLRKLLRSKSAWTLILILALGSCKDDPDNDETHTHEWGGWTLTKTATESADGEEAIQCTTCGEVKETRFNGEYATGTAGLVFALTDNDTAYRVSKGTAGNATALYLPAMHRPDNNSPYLPVTEIGNGVNTQENNAFGGTYENPNTNLASVTFTAGSQLKTIGDWAFMYCTSLASIAIPAGVTEIGYAVFFNCTGLISITIPTSVTSIDTVAFGYCTDITSITIPASVTNLGVSVFYDWTATQTINVPFANNNATPIGWDTLWKNNCNAVIKYWNGTTWEQPQEHAPQTINFGEGLSTTVTAPAMTDTQWNNVIAKLTAALDAAANSDDANIANTCLGLFGGTVNIELVKTQDYNYYKLDVSTAKILLNADYVIGATQIDLSAKVDAVIRSVFDNNIPLQAMVTPADGHATVPIIISVY